jgi:hypothetical protein
MKIDGLHSPAVAGHVGARLGDKKSRKIWSSFSLARKVKTFFAPPLGLCEHCGVACMADERECDEHRQERMAW